MYMDAKNGKWALVAWDGSWTAWKAVHDALLLLRLAEEAGV